MKLIVFPFVINLNLQIVFYDSIVYTMDILDKRSLIGVHISCVIHFVYILCIPFFCDDKMKG